MWKTRLSSDTLKEGIWQGRRQDGFLSVTSFTNVEFSAFIDDTSKRIDGDIEWGPDYDHSPSVEFGVPLLSDNGYPVVVHGSYNPEALALSYVLIYRGVGRIYALDLGKQHRNPDGSMMGDTHKHAWNEPVRDRQAYEPRDITAGIGDPVEVWKQFCEEARIMHEGVLASPVRPRGLFP